MSEPSYSKQIQFSTVDSLQLESIELAGMLFDSNNNIYYSKLTNLEQIVRIPNFRFIKLNQSTTNSGSIDLEFLPNASNFYKFLYNLDNRIIGEFAKNSKNLVGTQFSYDTIETLYNKTIKIPDYIPALPTITLSLTVDTIILDQQGEQIDIESIKEGNEVALLVTFDKVEFHKNRYRLVCIANCIQIKNGYCNNCLFID